MIMNNSNLNIMVGQAIDSLPIAEKMKVRNKVIVATKISRSLREKGLTQKDFARQLGKSTSEVSDILSGDRNLTIETMTDIERVLGVELINKAERVAMA